MSNYARGFGSVMYYNPKSVLVVSPRGRLRQVYVPFTVFSRELIDGKRASYIVDGVTTTKQDELVYIIAGKPFFYWLFTIDIRY